MSKRPKGWKSGTIYRLGDRLPVNHPLYKNQKGSPNSSLYGIPSNGQWVGAEWRGEYRAPRHGELYLSGCEGFVRAYVAPSDLTTEYFIAVPVLVESKTVRVDTIL